MLRRVGVTSGTKRERKGKIGDPRKRCQDTGETPPESHLLDAVRDLVEGEDDGGPIFECSWDDIESGRVSL